MENESEKCPEKMLSLEIGSEEKTIDSTLL